MWEGGGSGIEDDRWERHGRLGHGGRVHRGVQFERLEILNGFLQIVEFLFDSGRRYFLFDGKYFFLNGLVPHIDVLDVVVDDKGVLVYYIKLLCIGVRDGGDGLIDGCVLICHYLGKLVEFR